MSYAFAHWAGKRWVDGYLQNKALAREGRRLGYEDVGLPKYFEKRIKAERRAKAEKWTKSYRKMRARKTSSFFQCTRTFQALKALTHLFLSIIKTPTA